MTERQDAATSPQERGQILQQLRLAAGFTSAEHLAQQLGVHRSYVAKLERGAVDPLNVTAERFHTLAAIVRMTGAQLLAALGVRAAPERAPQPDRVIFTPIRELASLGHASAGPNADPDSHPRILMPSVWLHGNLRYVLVEGDSMAHPGKRGILDGDTALVDVSELSPQDSKVFVIDSAFYGVCVKRLRHLDGRWWAFSDNPDYAPFPLDDDTTILGRYRGVVNLIADE